MRLALDDGYTLTATTKATLTSPSGAVLADNLPVVEFKYRPALPAALAEWRYQFARAGSGKAELDATVKMLAAHLVSWDVTSGGGPAPLTADALARVPEPILNQIIDAVTSWKAGEAAGNSQPASA